MELGGIIPNHLASNVTTLGTLSLSGPKELLGICSWTNKFLDFKNNLLNRIRNPDTIKKLKLLEI